MTTERIERAEVNGAAPVPIGTMHDGVVYPSGDGEPMAENAYQYKAITDTVWTLQARFRDDPAVYVAGDMFIYYRRGSVGARLAPDVFVFAGAKGDHPRYSWQTWAEGGVPQFVLEVASPSTWERDATDKRDIYRNMGVLEYWRFDPESGRYFPEILIGECLVNGEYVRMEVRRDADGTLRGYSDFLKLDICVRPDGQIHLYDPAAREWLRTPDENESAARERDEAVRERDIANAEIERLRAALRAERGEG